MLWCPQNWRFSDALLNGLGYMDAACQLAEGTNSTLTRLELHWNPLGQKGAQALVDSLANNTSVESLWLPRRYKDTIQSSVVYSRLAAEFTGVDCWYLCHFIWLLIYSYLCSVCMYMYICMAWKYSCCNVWSWVMKIGNTYIVTLISIYKISRKPISIMQAFHNTRTFSFFNNRWNQRVRC